MRESTCSSRSERIRTIFLLSLLFGQPFSVLGFVNQHGAQHQRLHCKHQPRSMTFPSQRRRRPVVISSTANSDPSSSSVEQPERPPQSSQFSPSPWLENVWIRSFIQWLAQLSLADYKWRSDVFKTNQANRNLQDALARLQGATPPYVRPMDAPTFGPLGQWESESVAWLSSVIDEEGRRAQRIVEADGKLVRPSDNKATTSSTVTASTNDSHDNELVLGPLGRLELSVVEYFTKIQQAETERVRTKTWRPKDLDEQSRGPLGQLEWEVVQTLQDIQASETLRAQQIRKRGGEIVRPIDIPGPLGEWEMQLTQVIQAERRRFREREQNAGRLVRPKDATWQGPLGEAEATAYATIQSVSAEEMERLRNIQRSLAENRPMETNRTSLLGVAEALFVGLLRGPALLWEVLNRVRELLASSNLEGADQDRLRRSATTPPDSTQATKR
jgi:hypothetical protein